MVKAKKLAKKVEGVKKETSPYKRGDKVGVYGESGWATTGIVTYLNSTVIKVNVGEEDTYTFRRSDFEGISLSGERISLDIHRFDGIKAEKPVKAEPKPTIGLSDAQLLKDQAEQAHRMVYINWLWQKYFITEDAIMVDGLDKMLKDLDIRVPADLMRILGSNLVEDDDEDDIEKIVHDEEDDFALDAPDDARRDIEED